MASFFREPPPQKTGATQPGQDWLSRFSAFIYSLFPVSIANGGTGQITPQSAINALTQVGAATSGYVLTKDPANGNANWQPGGGGSGLVNSVTSTDVAITVSPTTGAVLLHGNNMVGANGSPGVHGLVPAPASGDGAAGKFLKADATWSVPSGTSTGTVTSVGLSLPAELTVSGSPVTTAGTLTAVWASETQHFVLAAPSGSSGTPSFRALVAGDIPALPYSLSPLTTKGDVWGFSSVNARIPVGGDAQVLTADSAQTLGLKWATPTTGTVTSVALTVSDEFSVSGSPVTSAGTLAISKANETANTVWAGPTSGGAAVPAFRSLVTADMPAGTGTVTSVALTMPAEFTVGGSPVTSSGTLAVTKANETANTVWAGPTSGGAAAPAFRALVTADMPAGTGTVTSVGTAAPITGGTITTTGTIAVSTMGGDSGSGGTRGVVPAPGAGDAAAGKFLKADATWAVIPASAGGALTLLSKVVTTSSATTITFSSISGSYTHLKIILAGRDTGNVGTTAVFLQMNGDATAAHYTSRQALTGTGSSASATTVASSTLGSGVALIPGHLGSANAMGQSEINIPLYAGTTFWKSANSYSYFVNDPAATLQVSLLGFTWQSTAAITSLVLTAANAFVDGTTASLYGMS